MNMIERIARAIHQALSIPAAGSSTADGSAPAWDDLPYEERVAYLKAARNALGAMRHPTQSMLNAGARRDLPQDADNIWERMIFTALTDHS
jgi:hypothetical protein